MYNIKIYETENGRSEIKEYIKQLNNKNSKSNKIKLNKIIAYIRMLKKYVLELGTPYIKHIDKEIWELRPIKNRLLFAYYKDNMFILLSIFTKKTQKTPNKEIEKAKRYLIDFKKRSEKYEEKI